MKENPARLVKHRPENNERLRHLTAEEEAQLRAVIADRSPRHLPELELALHTGLRLSEQYALTWENLDLDRRLLTITRSKNGATRHVPLNSAALRAIETLRAGESHPTGPVFRQASGEPLTSPRKWFEPAVRHPGIRGFSWHCLRHTFASRLVMAGVDLRTVGELGGWKTLQMVMRYAHLAPAHTLAAVERLAKAVSEEPTDTTTDTAPTAPSVLESVYVQ